MKKLIGLWVFEAYSHGGSGKSPMPEKPFLRRVFFTYSALRKFMDKSSLKYKQSGLYPDYCHTFKKVFGNAITY